MASDLMQIGEVAERTGLSLRTIRYYEEVGIVAPSARSTGGFRLYTDADVARLQVIKRMKPLDFSLDQMRDLLSIIDRLGADRPALAKSEKTTMAARLREYQDAVAQRCEALRRQLDIAEDFAGTLAAHSRSLMAARN
jgi:DNA-binding transcriptional MerR regulator